MEDLLFTCSIVGFAINFYNIHQLSPIIFCIFPQNSRIDISSHLRSLLDNETRTGHGIFKSNGSAEFSFKKKIRPHTHILSISTNTPVSTARQKEKKIFEARETKVRSPTLILSLQTCTVVAVSLVRSRSVKSPLIFAATPLEGGSSSPM